MKIGFWGVRGTLPVSGEKTVKYGGNTSCVSLELPSGELFIFDAGTGIRQLGQALVNEQFTQKEISIFISHPHWDHINALPFFAPLYVKSYKCQFFGPRNQNITVRQMISDQMNGVYFPITIREFNANLSFTDLGEETVSIGQAQISSQFLNHPGNCLGYKVSYQGKTFAYITDNEIFDRTSNHFQQSHYDRLVLFVKDVDVLITDSTYLNHEYPTKVGWGHSSIGQVVGLAHEAQVKHLCLFHHDPDQNDVQIEEKLQWATQKLVELKSSTTCSAPAEGSSLHLDANMTVGSLRLAAKKSRAS